MKPGGWGDDAESRVAEEIEHYLELRAAELQAQGLAPEEARREAERRFGSKERVSRSCVRIQRRKDRRDERRRTMRGWGKDAAHAFRGLARARAVTGAAVLTLALAIGANTAVFSVLRGVLLRPLPFPEPDALVSLFETRPVRGRSTASPANYLDWRARTSAFSSLSAVTTRPASLLEGDAPTRIRVAVVSGNFFETLRVEARVGRTFDPALRIDPSIQEVVLSHALWMSELGGDPGVVGRTLRVDEATYEVLGVMPPELAYPEGAQLWIRAPEEAPGIPGYEATIRDVRTAWYLDVVGRLGDGQTPASAQAELDAIAAALREEHPGDNEAAGIGLTSLHSDVVGSSRPLLYLLVGAVGLVLLAACANVANLFLIRSEGRRRDFAVRAALGAGEARLVRFVMTEGLIVAAIGGALGAMVGAAALPGLRSLLPADVPRRGEIELDAAVLGFSVAVSLLACLLFALAPALLARRSMPAAALAGRAGDGGGAAGRRIRGALVVAEVALGVLLAAGTGLVVRSVGAMATVGPGFRADGLGLVRVSFPDVVGMPDEARRARWHAIRQAVDALPSVASVGVGIAPPTERGPQAGLNVIRDDTGPIDASESVVWHPASVDFLETLGVPLLRGRPFTDADRADAVHVAIVSETLARRFFPGENPLGRRVTIGLDEGHGIEIEIVGVARDTRNRGPTLEPLPVLYRPLEQAGGFSGGDMVMVARAQDPAAALADVTAAIRRVDATAVVFGPTLGVELDARFFRQHRFVLSLLGAFSALALGLAGVGIYGVTAHAVGRRRRELGIRMAMGASRSRVWLGVLGAGLRPVLLGTALGLAGAVVGQRALGSLLFGVDATDPATHATVALTLLAVACSALAFPAAQAVRVNPAETMRAE